MSDEEGSPQGNVKASRKSRGIAKTKKEKTKKSKKTKESIRMFLDDEASQSDDEEFDTKKRVSKEDNPEIYYRKDQLKQINMTMDQKIEQLQQKAQYEEERQRKKELKRERKEMKRKMREE